MQIVIKESNQIALLAAIAKWKENEDNKEDSFSGIFIMAIMFTPYYNGQVSAIVAYRYNVGMGEGKIDVKQTDYNHECHSDEGSVFNAMQGGSD